MIYANVKINRPIQKKLAKCLLNRTWISQSQTGQKEKVHTFAKW